MTLPLPPHFAPAPPLPPASQPLLPPDVHLSSTAPSARPHDPFGPSPGADQPLLGMTQPLARGEQPLFREEQPLSRVVQPPFGEE